MEHICEALSAKIYSASKGGYEIFYEDELLDTFPDGSEKNRDMLEAALKKLVKCGCIDVKYAKSSAFCIAGYKNYLPDIPAPVPVPVTAGEGREDFNLSKISIAPLWMAFTGSFIGSLIAGLVFLLTR